MYQSASLRTQHSGFDDYGQRVIGVRTGERKELFHSEVLLNPESQE